MKRNARSRARRAGFTLTEMLIVLAILVMLVAMVVPRFLGAQKKADRQTATAQIALFRGCLERYALDLKNFPTTEQGLEALLRAPSDAGSSETGSSSGSDWDGPYVSTDAIPLDPWKNPYQYVYPPERGQGDLPDIWSYGPDGEDNTDDDICSWGTSSSGDSGPGGPRENLDIDIDTDFGRR
jgi:general secretion pathway protein G